MKKKRMMAILLTGFMAASTLADFAESYNAAGGDCTVINLPDLGVTGNSHFMFQEENNGLIADYIAAWLESRGLN